MADGIRLGGAYYELTADDSELIRALARSQGQAKSFSDAIAKSMGSAASSTDQSMKKIAASTQQASVGFTGLTKSAIGFGVAVVGVATAAETLRATIGKVATETQKAEQAQFALNQLYGAASPIITKFAEAQADAIGRSRTDAKEAAASVATLARNYALTGDQIQKVLTISANLAAVRGIGLAEAAERTQSAIRGEAEAIEYLGIAVQSNALKALANMTDAERKHFETLSDVTRAQIILNAITDQSLDLQGAAAERLKTSAGAADALRASIDNLAMTVGQHVAPAFNTWELAIANVITRIDQLIKKNEELALAPFTPPVISELDAEIRARTGAPPRPGSPSAQPPGRLPGPGIDPAEVAAMDAQEAANQAAREKRAAAARKDAAKAALEAADKVNDATAESAIRAIEKEKQAKERWYSEEQQRIEERRDATIRANEAARDRAVKALEDEKQAAKDSFDQQIKDAERAKDERLRLIDEVRDRQNAAIEDQKAGLDRAREVEDRDTSDRRRHADQEREDARRVVDRQRDDEQTATLRRLDLEKQARLDAIDEEIKAEQKRAEAAIRNIERQADRATERSQDAIRGIEREASAEDERHRKVLANLDRLGREEDDRHRLAVRNIEDESRRQLDAIQAQLDALDAAEHQQEQAGRAGALQQAVTDAQAAVRQAQGTGTPEQVAGARGDLTNALRVGNETSIANARERLAKLAGQGAEAVKKANDDLVKALADLQNEQTKNARDGERDRLRLAQSAIQARTDSEKDAEDERSRLRKAALDGDRQEEDDRDRRRKADLDKAKQTESDRLADYLKKLDVRKQARQDDSKQEVEDLRRRRDVAQSESDVTIQKARDDFAERTRLLEDRRREEDRDREIRQTAEDREREDRRKAEDLALDAQRAAVAQTYDDAKRAAEDAYNGPNGIITGLRKASEETERQYSRQIAAEKAAYDAERQFAQDAFAAEIAMLQSARQQEIDALNARKQDYQDQAKAYHEMIQGMLNDLDEFIRKGSTIPRIGGNSEAVRSPGAGKLTSSSEQQTRSNASGKNVQGDLVSWLNDAMDITGAPDAWINDLMGLISRESSGDPHAKNPHSTASGLLQLIDSTWDENRDKSLPNNVFDPVANLVAGIRYISKRYKTPATAIQFWESQNPHWYARGGWITEPVIGRGLRSGEAYGFGEDGPEYVSPRRRYGGSASMLGAAPPPDYARMGGVMSSMHPGGAGGSSIVEGDVIFNGLTYDEAERRQRREQHRRALLHGPRRLR
jgi:hypothetical protein